MLKTIFPLMLGEIYDQLTASIVDPILRCKSHKTGLQTTETYRQSRHYKKMETLQYDKNFISIQLTHIVLELNINHAIISHRPILPTQVLWLLQKKFILKRSKLK